MKWAERHFIRLVVKNRTAVLNSCPNNVAARSIKTDTILPNNSKLGQHTPWFYCIWSFFVYTSIYLFMKIIKKCYIPLVSLLSFWWHILIRILFQAGKVYGIIQFCVENSWHESSVKSKRYWNHKPSLNSLYL